MSVKWQYFLGGLLLGVILSGIIFLIIAQSPSSAQLIVSKPTGLSELDSPGQKTTLINQGKININTASIDELTNLPGIGPAKALAIVEFREKYGMFENIEELLYVTGFGESLFASIKELVVVE